MKRNPLRTLERENEMAIPGRDRTHMYFQWFAGGWIPKAQCGNKTFLEQVSNLFGRGFRHFGWARGDCLLAEPALQSGKPAAARPEKITFAEMRESGVRGVLVYRSDYRAAATRSRSWLIGGPTISGCPISSRSSPAEPVASAGPICARTSSETLPGRTEA
jgi:hypothetical protein